MEDQNYFPSGITITEAAELQKKFAEQIVLKDLFPAEIKTIAGAVFYSRNDLINASVYLFEVDPGLKTFKLKDSKIISEKTSFPAVPSFEGFREGKVVCDILKDFDLPDILMIDGHGINHPRKFGIASHVGLALDISTIAVSKDMLAGKIKNIGGKELVFEGDSLVAQVVKKSAGSMPLYVSPGHKITLETSVKITRQCMKSFVPEPLKIARENLIKNLNF